MRTLAAAALALLACGGAQKPTSSEADTASLEPGPASSDAPPGDTATAARPPAPSAPAPAAEVAAAPAFHPVPGTTGSIDGKPFSPRLAQLAGPVQKDGRVLVMLHEGNDCITPATAKPGDATMTLMVPWKQGYKVDLGSLRRARKGSMGEAAFVRVSPDNKSQVATTFKPTGLVTIVSAPTEKDAIGKMKIDLQSGDYMLSGDLDVKVCSSPR